MNSCNAKNKKFKINSKSIKILICPNLVKSSLGDPHLINYIKIPNGACTMFIMHTMNLVHYFTYLYILQV